MKCCCFIGHKRCPREIKERLLKTIETLIVESGVTHFYVGTQGGFDKLVYDILCELEERHTIQTTVVLAYLNNSHEKVYYDTEKTIFPDELTKTPLRFAISKRNSFLINRCEYLICYLETPFSNTHNIVREALKKKKEVINIGSFDIQQ